MTPLFVLPSFEHGQHLGARPRRPGSVRGELWRLPGGGAVVVEGAGRVDGQLVDGVDERLLDLLDHLAGVRDGVVRRALVDVRVGLRQERAWCWLTDRARARVGRQSTRRTGPLR